MTSFFKNMQKTRLMENAVKDQLLESLNAAVKNVQIYKQLAENDIFITSEDAGKELVLVLESIFIHGVKETLADRISSALGDPDRRPAPEFWSPMMIFTHPHIISQVNGFSQIANDVGRSRAWIRLCLNEGNFLGYLLSISQDMKTLRRFYKNVALLLDKERLDTAMGYFQGLSQFRFSLPTNSSMFNYWSNEALMKAGFWTPAIKESSLPVSAGFDVAPTLPDEAAPAGGSDSESVNSLGSSANQTIPVNDEAILREILSTPLNTPPVGSPSLDRLVVTKLPEDVERKITASSSSSSQTENDDNQKHLPRPNPFDSASEDSESPEDPQQPPPEPQRSASVQQTINDKYENLLKALDQPNKPNSLMPESKYREWAEKAYRPQELPQPSNLGSPGDSDIKVDESFVIVEKPSLSAKPSEFKNLVDLILSGKITQEPGLDSQGFCCKEPKCRAVIGISSIKARVCAMSGFYYCVDCFKNQEFVIPARIIHNWDFMKYPVSPHSFEFLSGASNHPLINIRTANPRLYFAVEEMDVTNKLRMKLNLLRQYFSTCSDPTKDRLRAMFWPREYLYEHVHLYSIDDLLEVAEGSMSVLLKKAIVIAEDHVRSCVLCSQKGFICELCRTPETSSPPIFPFDIDIVHRCSPCGSSYHKECMKKAEDGCPKCSRIALRKRQIERNLSEES